MERTELIEKLRDAAGSPYMLPEHSNLIEHALAVFEEQQRPGQDEREALIQAIRDSLGVTPETIAAGHQRPGNSADLADSLIARGFGFRRPVSPEPQAEPKDAQVQAALKAWGDHKWYNIPTSNQVAMRAALRAASSVRGENRG